MIGTQQILKELLVEYTQEELSRHLNISLRSVQNYLTGTEPRRVIQRKIREFNNANKKQIIELISQTARQLLILQRELEQGVSMSTPAPNGRRTLKGVRKDKYQESLLKERP